MTYLKYIIPAVIVIAVAFGVYHYTHQDVSLGAVSGMLAENYNPYLRTNGGYNSQLPIKTTGTFQVGTNGTAIPKLITGTSPLIGVNGNITASTSVAFDIAVTGVVSGDVVLAQFATSSASTAGPGWEIIGASASTTAGFITLIITNGTGATAYPPASVASTTEYLVL